jgi:prepilin-type N-terminal cleavage/methylation domain-containing protein
VFKKAFTLVEMMIVVTIIAILVGMALPQYNKYIRKTKTTEGIRILKQIAEAEILYKATNGYYSTTNISFGSVREDALGIEIDKSGVFNRYDERLCDSEDPSKIGVIIRGSTIFEESYPIYMYIPNTLNLGSPEKGYEGNLYLQDYIQNKITGNAPECP